MAGGLGGVGNLSPELRFSKYHLAHKSIAPP